MNGIRAVAAVAAVVPIPLFSGTGGRRSTVLSPASYRPIAACADADSSQTSISVSNDAGAAAIAPAATSDGDKPSICTADELHYAVVPGTEWKIALWRYRPSQEAPARNHPLMLLSGVGTNAIGFDLSPGASFARYMASEGFDTWIVEVRGAGLSMQTNNHQSSIESSIYYTDSILKIGMIGTDEIEKQSKENSDPELNSENTNLNGKQIDLSGPKLVSELTTIFVRLAERLSGYLNESQLKDISAGFLLKISKLLEDTRLSKRLDEITEKISGLVESGQNSIVLGQIRDLSQHLVNIIDEGQQSVSPQLYDLHERLLATIEDFQNQLDLITTYNWDFDHYLEEDIPAAMEYIRLQTKTKDGKVLGIGHSMGGILLYAMLSKCAYDGISSGLAAIVTLSASVDYTSSNSSLKLLLPLADPAQVLNVPVVPLGALLAAAYPLSTYPPYALSWLNSQISAQDMMHPELFGKLVLNNFCTVPAKVILQLTTAFREGGMLNRTGDFSYKDHLHRCHVPVLALAGDLDLICPPEAVYETVKHLPEEMVTYKVFGKSEGPHYAHYDLVGGRLAVDEVYPCIIEFLAQHDKLSFDGVDNSN